VKIQCLRLIGGGYGLFIFWSRGIFAVEAGWHFQFGFTHYYAAAMWRYQIMLGPFCVEWAYIPKGLSYEQGCKETAEAVAKTIRKVVG